MIPYFPILIASVLTCEHAENVISLITTTNPNRVELIDILRQSSEKGCDWDAKAD